MKFIKIDSSANSTKVLEFLRDNERTNRNVAFDERLGKPFMHIKEQNGNLKIKCELIGRATKDNGFLEGTYFKGKIKDTESGCRITGVIVTAPIFHIIMLTMFLTFIALCFIYGGFSVMPILLVIFDVFMFFTEFRKQGLIQRYISRAERRSMDPRFER